MISISKSLFNIGKNKVRFLATIVADGDFLHRFPNTLKCADVKLPNEKAWSNRRMSESRMDVCLVDAKTVGKYGITTSMEDKCVADKIAIKPRGVSLFRATDIHLQMALHSLLNANGTFIDCKILPADTKIESVDFLHDRNFLKDGKLLGEHILAVPNINYERSKLDGIAMAEYPPDAWKTCPYFPPTMSGGPPMSSEDLPGGGDPNNKIDTFEGKKVYYIPEPEGDVLNVIAHIYLSRLAFDVTQDIDDRLWAMTYIFETANFKDWNADLPKHPSAHHIVHLVYKALTADMAANGGYSVGSDVEAYELQWCIDFWLDDAVNKVGLSNLQVAMDAVKLPPLPVSRRAVATVKGARKLGHLIVVRRTPAYMTAFSGDGEWREKDQSLLYNKVMETFNLRPDQLVGMYYAHASFNLVLITTCSVTSPSLPLTLEDSSDSHNQVCLREILVQQPTIGTNKATVTGHKLLSASDVANGVDVDINKNVVSFKKQDGNILNVELPSPFDLLMESEEKEVVADEERVV